MNIYFKFYIVLQVFYQFGLCARFDLQQMKCLVCQRIVEEIEKAIENTSPDKKIDIGSYRLDAGGEMKKSVVELRRSEIFLEDVVEKICEKLDDYVRTTYKSNGQLAIIKLINDDGKMNPDLQDVDIVQDGEIHTLKYHCESIVEEHEDVLMKLFRSGVDNIDIRLCSDSARYCHQTIDDDYNFEEKEEL